MVRFGRRDRSYFLPRMTEAVDDVGGDAGRFGIRCLIDRAEVIRSTSIGSAVECGSVNQNSSHRKAAVGGAAEELAESEPIRQLLLPPDNWSDGVNFQFLFQQHFPYLVSQAGPT